MYTHVDRLSPLAEGLPLSKSLEVVHEAVKERFPFIDRIAVAAYDPKTGLLKTFLGSNSGERPLVRYEASMDEAPSLKEILEMGRPRVVNDLGIFHSGLHEHTRRIERYGYKSSYTVPVKTGGTLSGFLFFNSYEPGVFQESVLHALDVYAHLVAGLIAVEMAAIRTLAGAVAVAHDMVHSRDPETGSHLDRMAEFSRLIARQLAEDGTMTFSDEEIEQLFLFAPLHDLGKIGIPDRVLRKPGRLVGAEVDEMRTHAQKGVDMIDEMIRNFGLGGMQGLEVLRSVALCHHEALDGSGYPRGLQASDIPIQARIVAVADVFDALTSPRCYKRVWTNDEAFDELRRLAGVKLDVQCVEALERNRVRVEAIQARYHPEPDRPYQLGETRVHQA